MRGLVASIACVAVLLACTTTAPGPTRQLIFWFQNDSFEGQTLVPRTVGGVVVGATQPTIIPARSRILVTLTVPQDEGWALYLAAHPTDPVLYGSDFLRCAGPISLEIQVDEAGDPGWSSTSPMC